jgi:hypothetical protein
MNSDRIDMIGDGGYEVAVLLERDRPPKYKTIGVEGDE